MTHHRDLKSWPKYNRYVKANKLYGKGEYKKALHVYAELEKKGKEYGEDISKLIDICTKVTQKKRCVEDAERYIIKKAYDYRNIFILSFLPLLFLLYFLCDAANAMLLISVLVGTLAINFAILYRIGRISSSDWDDVDAEFNYFRDFCRFVARCKNCGRYGNNVSFMEATIANDEIVYTECKICNEDASPDSYFDQRGSPPE